jgi:hypothetical protein
MFLLASCNTEINTADMWQNIPVVYAIVNPNDSVHYIRINRAFLGNLPAADMAQHGDSLQYSQNVDVVLNVYNERNELLNSHLLTKEYIDKDSVNLSGNAICATDGHHVYVLRQNLLNGKDYSYELNMNFHDGLQGYSKIIPVYGFEHLHPPTGTPVDLLNLPTSKFGCAFKMPYSAETYKIIFTFDYFDVYPDGFIKKENIIISTGKLRVGASTSNRDKSFTIASRLIYTRFQEVLDSLNKNVSERFLGPISIQYFFADKNLSEFMFNKNNTLNYETAPLTNIRNCIGVFGSREFYRVERIRPSPITYATFYEKLKKYKFQSVARYPVFLQNLPDSLQ